MAAVDVSWYEFVRDLCLFTFCVMTQTSWKGLMFLVPSYYFSIFFISSFTTATAFHDCNDTWYGSRPSPSAGWLEIAWKLQHDPDPKRKLRWALSVWCGSQLADISLIFSIRWTRWTFILHRQRSWTLRCVILTALSSKHMLIPFWTYFRYLTILCALGTYASIFSKPEKGICFHLHFTHSYTSNISHSHSWCWFKPLDVFLCTDQKTKQNLQKHLETWRNPTTPVLGHTCHMWHHIHFNITHLCLFSSRYNLSDPVVPPPKDTTGKLHHHFLFGPPIHRRWINWHPPRFTMSRSPQKECARRYIRIHIDELKWNDAHEPQLANDISEIQARCLDLLMQACFLQIFDPSCFASIRLSLLIRSAFCTPRLIFARFIFTICCDTAHDSQTRYDCRNGVLHLL